MPSFSPLRCGRARRRRSHVALLFHWPSLGRQAHITGEASLAERSLAEELFAERDLLHQLQTAVSRQGEQIEDLDLLRARLAHLAEVQEAPPLVQRSAASQVVGSLTEAVSSLAAAGVATRRPLRGASLTLGFRAA